MGGQQDGFTPPLPEKRTSCSAQIEFSGSKESSFSLYKTKKRTRKGSKPIIVVIHKIIVMEAFNLYTY